MTATHADVDLERRLQQIAQRLTPCPIPDATEGWDLCAHGLPWPYPNTEAAWIARGLDRDEQVSAPLAWLRGERSAAGANTILHTGGPRA